MQLNGELYPPFITNESGFHAAVVREARDISRISPQEQLHVEKYTKDTQEFAVSSFHYHISNATQLRDLEVENSKVEYVRRCEEFEAGTLPRDESRDLIDSIGNYYAKAYNSSYNGDRERKLQLSEERKQQTAVHIEVAAPANISSQASTSTSTNVGLGVEQEFPYSHINFDLPPLPIEPIAGEPFNLHLQMADVFEGKVEDSKEKASMSISRPNGINNNNNKNNNNNTNTITSSNLPLILSYLKPFDFNIIRRRNNNLDFCAHCNLPHRAISTHYKPIPCQVCYGNILLCPDNISHPHLSCLVNQAIWTSLKVFNPSQRLSLLSEMETEPGKWHCIYCSNNNSQSWLSRRPHQFYCAESGMFIPGCQSFGTMARQILYQTSSPHNFVLPPSSHTSLSEREALSHDDHSHSLDNIRKDSFKFNNSDNIHLRGNNNNKVKSQSELKECFSYSNDIQKDQKENKGFDINNNIHNMSNSNLLSNDPEAYIKAAIARYHNELERQNATDTTFQTRKVTQTDLKGTQNVEIHPQSDSKLRFNNQNDGFQPKIHVLDTRSRENDRSGTYSDGFEPEVGQNPLMRSQTGTFGNQFRDPHTGINLSGFEKYGYNPRMAHNDPKSNESHGFSPITTQNSRNYTQFGDFAPENHSFSTNFAQIGLLNTHSDKLSQYEHDTESQTRRLKTQTATPQNMTGGGNIFGPLRNDYYTGNTKPNQKSFDRDSERQIDGHLKYSSHTDDDSNVMQQTYIGNTLHPYMTHQILSNRPYDEYRTGPLQTIYDQNRHIQSRVPNVQNSSQLNNAASIQSTAPTFTIYRDENTPPGRPHIKLEKGGEDHIPPPPLPPIRIKKEKMDKPSNFSKPIKDEPDEPSDSDSDSSSSSSSSEDESEKKKKRKGEKKGKKSKESSDSDNSSSEEEATSKDNKNTLFNLLKEMTCDKEYAKALVQLKSIFTRKSELPELQKYSRYNNNPKFSEYFPELYSGKSKRLKKYLTKLLTYTAYKAKSHQERADMITEGIGLTEECVADLEMAADIPLPGLASTYPEDKTSQKKRLLELLLTFVILYYKDEPISALQDVRLKGPHFTGITKLYQKITDGNSSLPAKFIEEYLCRAILRAENGMGDFLLKTFQTRLSIQKQLDPTHAGDENKTRRLIYNCCATLANDDSSLDNEQSVGITRMNSKENTSRNNGQKWGSNKPTHTRFERINYAAEKEEEEYLVREFTNMVNDRPSSKLSDREPTRQEKIASFKQVFMTPPCKCCGSPNHTMLHDERGPDGKMSTEYACPVAACKSWNDARRSTSKPLKYNINAEKFAVMCGNDSQRVMEAWRNFTENGSGRFKTPADLAAIKTSILSYCKSQSFRGNKGPPTTTEARTFSCRAFFKHDDKENIPPPIARTRSTIIAVHTGEPTTDDGYPIHGTLHLLLATKVEPANGEDIRNFQNGDHEGRASPREEGPSPRSDPSSYRVRLLMPDGESFVVPYREVQGRILADTGSTTTLIDEEFAQNKGLSIEPAPYNIILKDVNNGERNVANRCYLRLTLTTVTGREVIAIILALCVPNLSHDLLLGTRDLERYQVSVIPHLGQAKMTIGEEEMVFPMLDEDSIKQLQHNLHCMNIQTKC